MNKEKKIEESQKVAKVTMRVEYPTHPEEATIFTIEGKAFAVFGFVEIFGNTMFKAITGAFKED